MREYKYYRLNIVPVPFSPERKKGIQSRARTNFVTYRDELALIAKAQHFKATAAMKIVFIIPFHQEMLQARRDMANGDFHRTDKDIITLGKLVEGVRHALVKPHGLDLCRVDAAKYYGAVGCIIIKNLIEKDFDIIRKGLL